MVEKSKAGYEYLLAYKLTVPIYDYTVVFCKRYISYKSRTKDQMEQAARSGMANIAEGYQQNSLAGYLKLVGISSGSLEELLKDFLAFARQNNIQIWTKERAVREVRELGEIWKIIKGFPTLPDTPDFPDLPGNTEKAVNLMLTLINQACYLLHKLSDSLEEKHTKEGGYNEKLFKKRLDYRKRNQF